MRAECSEVSQVYTPRQVAEVVGVDVATVRRWLSTGVRGRRLPSRLIGGRRYVRTVDLAKFVGADIAGEVAHDA